MAFGNEYDKHKLFELESLYVKRIFELFDIIVSFDTFMLASVFRPQIIAFNSELSCQTS